MTAVTTSEEHGNFATMKNQVNRTLWVVALAIVALAGCTTPVDVDLPEAPVQGVMEAFIRLGEPPFVFLTTTQGYFDAVDASALADLYVDDAEVVMTVDGEETPLIKLCTADLPTGLVAEFAMDLGVAPSSLQEVNICFYTAVEPSAFGAVGSEYTLEARWDEDGLPMELRSTTRMPVVPQLDSIWFEIPETSTNDSLGLIWTAFTDPEGFGDAYRWASKREGKDPRFFYPLGSVFDDAFVDGQSFPFVSFRSPQPGVEEVPGEEGFWKTGDTVVVRLDGIDHDAFQVLRDFETSVANQGNPFALPTSASTNVEGGLGWFVAYAEVTDTTVCVP